MGPRRPRTPARSRTEVPEFLEGSGRDSKGWTGYRALYTTFRSHPPGLPSGVSNHNLPVSQVTHHHAVEVYRAFMGEQLVSYGRPLSVLSYPIWLGRRTPG
ncbi:hypothetical protein EVAR_37104_1 [Eumeta japonica]|uniref:Uncharacterized protein n=1 Tax=Eumeta variegata TaxID=151549 RepID=A0A4C1XMT6_EUMVA|nr:hypothetical protein EVAR_37104_1 [Eumeta japonica]